MKKQIMTTAVALVLGGCSASYSAAPLGSDHPASPQAGMAQKPARSGTLDLTDADPITPMPTTEGMQHGGRESSAPREPAAHAPGPAPAPGGASTYTCPMHPEVISDQPGRCPDCGMKLVPKPEGKQ